MNAVEIEEAVSQLAEAPFDRAEFPYAFLQAFGNKETTLRKLRSGASNKSDIGGLLQHANIHILVTERGKTGSGLGALRASPATAKARAKFILATDGEDFEAEDLETGETVACAYQEFPDHFGFFLGLAGITTVKQVRESSFDIRATGRLNRLYVELLKDNADWGANDRRPDMNHFMARLIFCFFAEDTGIFHPSFQFTDTVEKMSERDGSNTHQIISELFRAMNTKVADRQAAGIARWADPFPYVNGELFCGSVEVPRFSRIARSYLIHIGSLDWTKINPDIFGSMIQAVADDEERGALGMHYTSVPNILKALNPLFIDDLRGQLEEAADNGRKLLNLRIRMSKIRVFDPACGSGNFLVIAYKEMRAIEAEINRRRGEEARATDIPKTNFRGIELRSFPAEIARLALIIAEYQCDVLYRGQQLALADFLPLDSVNWVTCGNALQLDWFSLCPPTGTVVRHHANDLFHTPLNQAQIDFENEGGETYICGNPPYYGSRRQQEAQKDDLRRLASSIIPKWRSLDYVAGWLLKAKEYASVERCRFAFVCTSSIVEGLQVGLVWPHVLGNDRRILFGHRTFRWSNLAKNNAGVSVVIVGVGSSDEKYQPKIFEGDSVKAVDKINPYLVPADTIYVDTMPNSMCGLSRMVMGSMPRDGGNLILDEAGAAELVGVVPEAAGWVRRYFGSDEIINGIPRYCLWIHDDDARAAAAYPELKSRFEAVRNMRRASSLASTNEYADQPHRFVYLAGESTSQTVAVGAVSSENRDYLPVDLLDKQAIVSNAAFAIYDAPLWNLALIASRLHLVWIATVCGKLESRYRYSNTLGWNTFPVPTLTDKNKADLTSGAVSILMAREAHFPDTIADLYDPKNMPDDLRRAHESNDEMVERIYVGRRFRNDTERLEKLFDLYMKHASRSGAKERLVKVGA